MLAAFVASLASPLAVEGVGAATWNVTNAADDAEPGVALACLLALAGL